MADLSTLMQYAPTTAAGFMGINQADQEQEHTMKMQELAQLMQQRMGQEQRAAQLHPLAMQEKQLGLRRTEAELPGILARGENDQVTTAKNRATQQSSIDATNAENHEKIMGKAFSTLGTMSHVQNGIQLGQELEAAGVPKGLADSITRRFGNLSGPALQQEIKRVHENFLRSNPEYVKVMDQTDKQQAGATKRAEIMAANRVEVKGMGGKKGTGNELIDQFNAEIKGKPPATQLTILNRYIQKAIAADDLELAQQFSDQAKVVARTIQSLPNAQPNPGTPNLPALSKGGIPVNETPEPFVPPMPGATPQPKPAAAGRVQPGTIRRYKGKDYRFKGGDQFNQSNWEEVK